MVRIAYFEVGRSHDNVFDQFSEKIDKIPIYIVKSINYMKYDIIIIPSYSNQDVLSEIKNKLEKFVEYGGIVVIMGACEDKSQWLPLLNYHKRFLETIQFDNMGVNRFPIIFENIDLTEDAFKFHDRFIAHGFFTCNENSCIPLLTGSTPTNLIMAVIEPNKAAGKYLITTLDPEYHASIGYAREQMEYNVHAQKLVQNIVKWSIDEGRKQPHVVKKFRMIFGISKTSLISSFLFFSISVCLISLIAFLLGIIEQNIFGTIASVSSVLSLALSILFKYY